MKILDRANAFLKSKRMTQQEFATRLGVHPVALNRLLRGHAGKASIALKLDAFLDEHGFPHDVNVPSVKATGEE